MNVENKIPNEIVDLIAKTWKGYLRFPMDKILNYVYENDIFLYEYERRNTEDILSVDRDMLGRPITEVIQFLSSVISPDKACLDISCGELVLRTIRKETDSEFANRVYHTVISPVDRKLGKARDAKKELQKERVELQKRLKEINSLLQ